MSSESKDELNGEYDKVTEAERKKTDRKNVTKEDNIELTENGTSHAESEDKDSAHSEGGTVVNSDTEKTGRTIVNTSNKLSNGTSSDLLESNNVEPSTSVNLSHTSIREKDVKTDVLVNSISGVDKDPTKHSDKESLQESVEKPDTEQKKESLSNEMKRSIVENVLSRYIQNAKKQKTDSENVDDKISTETSDISNTSKVNGTEACCDSQSDRSQVSESMMAENIQSKEMDTFSKSDKSAAADELDAHLKHTSEKGSENQSNSVPNQSGDTDTNRIKADDSKLITSERDIQNDLECPHLEPEAPMEVDLCVSAEESNGSLSAENSTVNNLTSEQQSSQSETNSQVDNQVKELKSKSQDKAETTVKVDNNLNNNIPSESVSKSKESEITGIHSCQDSIREENENATEKVIVYHEDTVRYVEKKETAELTCDKENSNGLKKTQKDFQENENKDGAEVVNTTSALSRNKSILESKKSLDPIPSKPKGQKLDELLSKIATKASSNLNIPKKAKARKSFSQSGNAVEKAVVSNVPVTAPSITSLTFNVKMLEKQGVLDIPKTQNKRKAFEPFKLKVKQSEGEKSPVKVSPVRSPLKSPKDSPFFNTNKVIKGRRRKKKKMGSYMLPSEKKARERLAKSKERKKASEERQTSDDEKGDSHDLLRSAEIKTHVKEEKRNSNAMDCSETKVLNADSKSRLEHVQDKERPLSRSSAISAASDSKQHNALEMLTKNSKLSFATTPNFGLKKAKKSVRPGVSHDSQTRTLDSFLKGETVAKLTSAIQQRQGQSGETSSGIQQAQESHDPANTGIRKRKADDDTAQSLAQTPPDDKTTDGQEEKKRKTEIPVGKSPPPVIQILAGSPPLPPGVRPIIASPNTSAVSFPQIVSPNSNQQPKTIIQNGTLNGLPVFQIIPNANFGQHQLVALGTQGQSLLPKTAILQSPPRLPGAPPGMPVILTPVPMPTVVSSGSVTSPQNQVSLLSQSSPGSRVNLLNKSLPSKQATSLTSVAQKIATPIAAPIPLSVFNQSIVPSQTGQMPVLNQILKSPLDQNVQLLKPSHIPNGLYPVTPPRTPDDQAGSDTGSQDSIGVYPGQQVSPDKDIIPLCTCKLNGASFPKLVSTITFCQALDSVDGKAMGCCNKVSNPQLVRPAVKIPFLVVCENHRKRLRCHQCCPGCGHFCTQGKFLQCRNEGNQIVHNFHEECQVIKDGKNYCPHCGETSEQVEVNLMLQEKKPPIVESKSSRIQTKAKMAIADKGSGSGDESAEEIKVVLEKTKKVLSTGDIPVGADKHSLERVLSSLTLERPKKYRHLPKCLYTPAYDNDLERVVYMLEDGHDANEKYDDLDGQGAIHAAAAVGSLPIVHMLVQAGASPHLQDKTLRTPLMYASENNHHQVVKYLLKAGAVIDSKADDGMTSLHYAAKAGHVGIIKVLLDVEGINIDVKDDGGYTPLIWAAEHEQLEVVKFLLKRNADPNLRDSEENTALHWAAFSGSSNVAEILLNAGCELDSLNMHGDRPLHIASRQDHYECVVLFLARGADVELENNKGEIPMQCCIDQSSPTYLALRVNKQLKGFGAKHMGRPEKLLHRDISKGRENIPIPCVNGIDDDGIPTDYLYVTDNIETKCLNINRVIGSLQCCQCKDDCSSIYCACGKSSVKCWYDKFGRLLPEFNMLEPSLIFECNRACECWTTCNNRVVQNGVMSRLQVFKTEGRGWGCKTLVTIPRGTFICEYIGEHISDSEADRREDDSYLFDLDNKDGETYCIDARKYGNVARFINHLCEPNLVPVKVFVDSQDLRFPRICLFASRDILAQEELGFDYGEKFWIIKWRHFTCTCGSPKCRYSKDTIQKTLEEYRLRHEEDIDVKKD